MLQARSAWFELKGHQHIVHGSLVIIAAAQSGVLLQKGGCDNGQAVIDAFARMMQQGPMPTCKHWHAASC